MRRRAALGVMLLLPLSAGLVAGCSGGTKRRGGSSRQPKGPQGFGNLMVPEWIKDLADKSADKRLKAAQELGNMGPAAKAALPALERATRDKDSRVSAAAKKAIASIKR